MTKEPKVNLLHIRAEDVFTESAGGCFLNGKLLTKQELAVLKEEVNYFEKTRLYQIFMNTLGDAARKTMFENAKDFEDMKWGKAILYALDVERKICDKIKQH